MHNSYSTKRSEALRTCSSPFVNRRGLSNVLSTFPSFANSFIRIVVPGRKKSRLNRITEQQGQPCSQKTRTWHRKSVMRPPYSKRGCRVPASRRKQTPRVARWNACHNNFAKKAQLLCTCRHGHDEPGTLVISFHRICCHSHVTTRISRLSSLLARLQDHRERRQRERQSTVIALKKKGKKSDARISSNPCANVAQCSSFEDSALSRGVPFLSILWSTYKGSAMKKRGWTTGRNGAVWVGVRESGYFALFFSCCPSDSFQTSFLPSFFV